MTIEVTEEMRMMARAFREADADRIRVSGTDKHGVAIEDTRYAAIRLARLVSEAVEREEKK